MPADHELARRRAAVGVVDAIVKIGVGSGRWGDDEDLVATDAEATITDAPDLIGAQLQGAARRVEHDEVVAQAVHFGEFNTHVGDGDRG